MTIKWKVPIFNADAQKCYEEISSLKTITPENIVEFASDDKTELHKCFEWNDEEAAKKYRLSQARKVVQLIVMKDESGNALEIPKRVFQVSSTRNVYCPIKFFVENRDEYNILLNRARNELMAFKKRYENISELEDVLLAIDELFKTEE